MGHRLLMPFLLLLSVKVSGSAKQEDPAVGFLPNCPGSNGTVVVEDNFASTRLWVVVQVHFPDFTYRKRFSFGNAVRALANDPDIDLKNGKVMMFLDGYLDTTHQIPVRVIQGHYAMEGYITMAIDCQLLNSFVYPIAARTNRQIGNLSATLLAGLLPHGLKAKNIELVGISMGGQTVSFTAKHFHRITGQKVGRITSLDPSGPCFRNNPTTERLTYTDADFVQVIHTATEGLGMGTAQGHVDFYINGGEFQYMLYTDQPWLDDLMSHVSAFAYYVVTFRHIQTQYVGVRCKDVQQAREHKCYENVPHVTNIMGRNADPAKPGIYYVPIQADPPYYAPEDFLETRPVYSLIYNDALSDMEHYVLDG